jgi:hypothetical protein
MTENIHEQFARYRKATALANLLQAEKVDSATAATFTDTQWRRAAFEAKVNEPHDLTRQCVIDLLRAREAAIERCNERNPADLIPYLDLPGDEEDR